MTIEILLENEIQNEFDELKNMEVGSEKHRAAVDGLAKLVDRAIEIKKVNTENAENRISREVDTHLKQQQIKDEQMDRLLRNGIAIAGIVIPSVITIWGTFKTLKFEEEGTVTTIMGRGFINKLLPKK